MLFKILFSIFLFTILFSPHSGLAQDQSFTLYGQVAYVDDGRPPDAFAYYPPPVPPPTLEPSSSSSGGYFPPPLNPPPVPPPFNPPPVPPASICGNGSLEIPEQCDDGNPYAGDGCSSYCTIETPPPPPNPPTDPPPPYTPPSNYPPPVSPPSSGLPFNWDNMPPSCYTCAHSAANYSACSLCGHEMCVLGYSFACYAGDPYF